MCVVAIAYRKDALVFSDNTPKPARDIMNRMIHPVSTERLGYSDSGFTKKTMYFNNVNSNNAWPNLAFATKQVVSALITPEPYDLESTSFRNNHAELTACSDADNALFACF